MSSYSTDYDDEPDDGEEGEDVEQGYVKWLAALAPKKKPAGEKGGTRINLFTRTTQVVDNSRSYSITGPRRSW